MVAAALAIGWGINASQPVEGRQLQESPFPERVRVPPLPEGLTWLNTSGPLELKDLRGKFVLMDFWTFCCINCMHILPELAKLEHAHPKELVVIGVHSAKFETEKDSKNITEAILRYQIRHPVINDANHAVWDRFGVHSWPTLLLIDPEGFAIWGTSGEITADQVEKVLKRAIPYYRQKGVLDETPLRFDMEAQRAPATPLRFPGKVLADRPGGRLFIADSNHNRIVVAKLDGTLLFTIGCGAAGANDGDFATAEFNDPQGLALRADVLYVADNLNHLIRKVDLGAKRVSTVAGLGYQNHDPPRMKPANPRKTALSSPWDLWIHGGDLYIAMAGCHQIWRMRLDESSIGPYAGNAREDIVDGLLLPPIPYELGFSSFAQPSGLTSDGTWLYVADSEGSSIRGVPFVPRGLVKTVVGTSHLPGGRLFTFGDADGPREQVLLQHPLGVAFDEGQIFVADTYNNKIKAVDPRTGQTKTLAGTGKPGGSDRPAQFDEPAGLSAAGGKLYVADTNNHAIRVIDLKSTGVTTLTIAGLEPPKPGEETSKRPSFAGASREDVAAVAVRPDAGSVHLDVALTLPAGYKINPLAPPSYWIEAVGKDGQPATGPVRRGAIQRWVRLEKPDGRFRISLPVDASTGDETLRVGLNYYYCREGAEGICKVGSVVWTVPLQLKADAKTSALSLSHRVRP